MKSMTGYGRARASIDGWEITIEIRSVNHRYLDINIKVPRAYGFIEEALKKVATDKVSRGKVDVFVSIETSGAQQTCIHLNSPLAASYFDALIELRDSFHLKDDITVMALAKLPDVLCSERLAEDVDKLTHHVISVFNKAIDGFESMRTHEGIKMAEDVRNRMKTLMSLIEQVEERSPQRVAEYRERLERRLNEILADTSLDSQRILMEAAIFADKTAVDEETVRLRSHLSQLYLMLEEENAVGRKLDFLVQEMNREVNTIGSKSNDAFLANLVISLKAEIEKIREQIQNIE